MKNSGVFIFTPSSFSRVLGFLRFKIWAPLGFPKFNQAVEGRKLDEITPGYPLFPTPGLDLWLHFCCRLICSLRRRRNRVLDGDLECSQTSFLNSDYSMTGEEKDYYWVVFVGRKPGIYTTWGEAQLQVNGYSGSMAKRYKTFDEAEEALLKFHEKRYELTKLEAKSSTSASAVGLQHEINGCWSFVLCFFLGFVGCILLALVLHSE
ncbi:uncharacterized protein LOC131318518 [Rhododendron vialii]|uniref:uncharacterized protein LOC131318518 n=1 Tax=Rhododendron vialii TaxID=182163 RepID=UPI00265DB461|nr:uncharacterized protein LOC131318518 [Rhododendron vialii]